MYILVGGFKPHEYSQFWFISSSIGNSGFQFSHAQTASCHPQNKIKRFVQWVLKKQLSFFSQRSWESKGDATPAQEISPY